MNTVARLFVVLLLAPVFILTGGAPTSAGCGESVSLKNIDLSCVTPGAEAAPTGTSSPKEYELHPMCSIRVNGVCGEPLRCTNSDGQPGIFHSVTIDGEPAGRWCIGDAKIRDLGIITPGQVLTAMRRLDWPASPLVIQPPDGLTLVNFDTNFYTTGTEPVTRRVTLLGQQVTIEATPSEYAWDFGDEAILRTTEPGAPYPSLTVTHSYLSTGTYRPSLSTTYAGRYRVGGGAWQQIPGTVTIDGTAQDLRAIEAQPKLVGY